MKSLKIKCHNEVSLFKASRGYLVRLPRHFVSRNDSSRGAMFGLDARIALAIFGALSVISGAALYSAIQNAKVERYWQEFQEMIKASEQYYLDNGKLLQPDSSKNLLYLPDLIENREGLRTWKGPYFIGEKYNANAIINTMTKEFADNAYFYVYLLKKSTWVGNADYCDSDSVDCLEWIRFRSGTDGYSKGKKLFSQLDEKIDNNDGVKSGSVRMYDDGIEARIYIKGIQHKRI